MPYTERVRLRRVSQFILDGLSMLQDSPTAAKAYTHASTLDPLDPKPLSNLSAMYFEMGLYGKYVTRFLVCCFSDISVHVNRLAKENSQG